MLRSFASMRGDVAVADQNLARAGSWKPAIMRKVVVLPQPDGPSSVINSPGATSRLTSCTAAMSPFT